MTADGKFEIGDTVRCIEAPQPGEYQIDVGTIFTVVQIASPHAVHIRRIRDDSGECFRSELFELVQSFGAHKLLKRRTHEI